MPYSSTLAITYLRSHAATISSGHCAEHTRRAIEAGGIQLSRRISAKDYGDSLITAGFTSMGAISSGYQAGDVVIINSIPGRPHGHMAMYDGKQWISDFLQSGLYPGASYRSNKPGFVVYRHN